MTEFALKAVWKADRILNNYNRVNFFLAHLLQNEGSTI